MAKLESLGIRRLESIHYYVHDLQRSRRFYCELMDFEEVGESSAELTAHGRQKSVLFRAGDCNVICSAPEGEGGRAWRFLRKHPDGVGTLAFEVEDIDAQGMGNQWMSKQGWKHSWGIGRHIYGSQIFDYWFDPDGNIAEHFTDGDLVRPGCEPNFALLDDESLFAWGPPMQAAKFVNMAARHG